MARREVADWKIKHAKSLSQIVGDIKLIGLANQEERAIKSVPRLEIIRLSTSGACSAPRSDHCGRYRRRNPDDGSRAPLEDHPFVNSGAETAWADMPNRNLDPPKTPQSFQPIPLQSISARSDLLRSRCIFKISLRQSLGVKTARSWIRRPSSLEERNCYLGWISIYSGIWTD